jgi:hypothetical protein
MRDADEEVRRLLHMVVATRCSRCARESRDKPFVHAQRESPGLLLLPLWDPNHTCEAVYGSGTCFLGASGDSSPSIP